MEGTVDGRAVQAWWRNGVVSGDSDLLARARIVVSLGDAWSEGDLHVTASLAGPAHAVALTLMRACTTVESVQLPLDDVDRG